MTALDGIRVLDVTQVMAGPFCAMQLCDMGADVIKVEPPDGDSTRRMAGASGTDSAAFNAVNRGKRGIVLDLKTAAGQDAFRRLLARADILIENYRPGVMRAFGLDYASLAAPTSRAHLRVDLRLRPDRPGRGERRIRSRRAGRVGPDVGHRRAGRPPVKVGVPLTDLGAALFALSAILAALHYRTRTGRGQHIDTSLVEAGVALSVWESAQYFGDGVTPAADGIGASHDRAVSGDPLRRRLHHARRGQRSAVPAAVRAARTPGVGDAIRTTRTTRGASAIAPRSSRASRRSRTRSRGAHWLALFDAHGIPCGPINDYAEAFADPQVRARDMVVEIDHPTLGRMRTLGSPIKMSETPPVVGRRAPLLGEHTREVLLEAGCTDGEIAALQRTTR